MNYTAELTYRRQAKTAHDAQPIDVSEAARDADIFFPVALSRAVWNGFVTAPQTPDSTLSCSTQRLRERVRLWDLLWSLRACLDRITNLAAAITFVVDSDTAQPTVLHAVRSKDDVPVFIVMLPNES
jgi:hypothetical protein